MLTENDLRTGLRRMTDAPPVPLERFAAVERRAARTRRRRQSTAACVAALAVLLAAAPMVLRDRTPAPPVSPAPRGLPREVVVVGAGRLGVLPSLGEPVVHSGVVPVVRRRHLLQLAGGAILAIREDGVAVRLWPFPEGSGEPVVLGRAVEMFAGLRPDEVWLVEDLGDDCTGSGAARSCSGRYRAQRMSVGGKARGRAVTLPVNVKPIGEIADGLLVEVFHHHPGQSRTLPGGAVHTSDGHADLAVADVSSGHVGRLVAEYTATPMTAGGRIVWGDITCSAPCSLHVEEADGRRRDVTYESLSGAYDSLLSPDGRWYARAYGSTFDTAGQQQPLALIEILDIESGRVARLPYQVKSTVWAGTRLLFVTTDGRVGAYAAATGESTLSSRIPGHLEMVAGALDLLPD